MTRLSPEAERRLEDYLRQVRGAAAGSPAVDADEVVTDVREHVRTELRGTAEPAGRDELDVVLGRLGRPERWIPEEEMGPIRRTLMRLQQGPEDWRLAYLTFALMAVGVLFPWSLGPLVALSFILARPALSLAERRGGGLGERAWLVYPTLILVYLTVGAGLLVGPAALLLVQFSPGGWARMLAGAFGAQLPAGEWTATYVLLAGGSVALLLGVWWLAMGAVAGRRPGWVRALFRPFADGFETRHARWLRRAGLVPALAGSVALLLVAL